MLLLLAFLSLAAWMGATPAPTIEPAAAAVEPGPAQDQIVVLIGVDGLRADAIDRFPDAAPHLRLLAGRGVRAAGMVPAMPSVTFVNFYSIATGLYAEHTGIVSNSSYSRSLGRIMARGAEHSRSEWWGGEPIWVTAGKQGIKTATMFWLGSQAEIQGGRPSYWLPYDGGKPYHERTAQVLSWLALPEAGRPRLVTIYFEGVDGAEHEHGLGSEEEREAIAEADAEVGALVAGVAELGLQDRTNFIVVSDHGMTNINETNVVDLHEIVSRDEIFVPEFARPDRPKRGLFAHVFVKNGNINGVYEALAKAAMTAPFSVYRREHLPERWHLDNADRTGDIFVVADEGWLLSGEAPATEETASSTHGVHGYDRHLPSMLATFIADGPRFADGVTVEPFDNVEVYGIIAEILGVRPAPTDGDLESVRYFLTPPAAWPSEAARP